MKANRTCILATLSVLLLMPVSVLCAGEVKLAAMFSDHMVLQRDQPVPVWGRGMSDRNHLESQVTFVERNVEL